jgi:drug/metabolite transporter (DMT)-like permease
LTANLRGILCMVAAMAAFAVEDALIKAAAATVPPGQVILVIGLVGVAVFALAARRQPAAAWRGMLRSGPVWVRTLAEMAATWCMLLALVLVPLATVTAVVQAAPLMTVAGAALILGERVGWRRWAAIAVGFAGVLVILRPWGDGFALPVLWAVGAVTLMAARDLAARRMEPGVPTLLVAVLGNAVLVVLGAAMTMAGGGLVALNPAQAALLAAAAAVGLVGYWAIIEATRAGDVSVIAPFRYSRLLFGVALGVLAFGEQIDPWMAAGAALVIGSGLYTLYRERLRRLEGRQPQGEFRA